MANSRGSLEKRGHSTSTFEEANELSLIEIQTMDVVDDPLWEEEANRRKEYIRIWRRYLRFMRHISKVILRKNNLYDKRVALGNGLRNGSHPITYQTLVMMRCCKMISLEFNLINGDLMISDGIIPYDKSDPGIRF